MKAPVEPVKEAAPKMTSKKARRSFEPEAGTLREALAKSVKKVAPKKTTVAKTKKSARASKREERGRGGSLVTTAALIAYIVATGDGAPPAEEAEADKVVAKAAAEKAEADKVVAKAAAEKAEADKVFAEKAAAENVAVEKAVAA